MRDEIDQIDFELPDEVACEDEQQEMFEHYRFDISAGQVPMRVDKYLATHMEYTSRHRIQLAIKAEYIRVNDKIVKANYVVRPGDVVTFELPELVEIAKNHNCHPATICVKWAVQRGHVPIPFSIYCLSRKRFYKNSLDML